MLSGTLRFIQGLWRMPLVARIWVGWLVVVNSIVPLFFWDHLEAQVALAVFLTGAMLMAIITARTGFSRLLGAGHLLWYPLLFWLALRLDTLPMDGAVGIWVRALLATNAISLVIDTADVARWLRGDRAEMVEGLSAPCRANAPLHSELI